MTLFNNIIQQRQCLDFINKISDLNSLHNVVLTFENLYTETLSIHDFETIELLKNDIRETIIDTHDIFYIDSAIFNRKEALPGDKHSCYNIRVTLFFKLNTRGLKLRKLLRKKLHVFFNFDKMEYDYEQTLEFIKNDYLNRSKINVSELTNIYNDLTTNITIDVKQAILLEKLKRHPTNEPDVWVK
jgi:hypothetical protein